MNVTLNCICTSDDKLEVSSIGKYVQLAIGNESVILDVDQLKSLDAALDAHVEAYDLKPQPVRKIKTMNYAALTDQAKLVYRHMDRAGSISARDAMDDYGITSATLARRICDIEAEGFKVYRDRRIHPITGKRYTRYALTL